MNPLKRMGEKLPKNVGTSAALEAGYYVGWHQGTKWHSVTDRLPSIGEVVYAYGYRWNVDADNLDGYMYRCFLGEDGLWTHRPGRDDGRNNDRLFESHEIDFWREIPEEEK